MLYFQGEASEVVAYAGASDTCTTINFKQRIVGRALDKNIFHIQKLMFLPVQISASMRAAIVVGVELAIFVHHENIVAGEAGIDLKTPATRVRYVRSCA